MDSPRAKVQARYLPMLAPLISSEETRYYLTGVRIESHPAGGALLIATDGRRLGVIHDSTGEVVKPGIFPLSPDLLREVKVEIYGTETTIVEFDGECVALRKGNRKTFVGLSQFIDGEFPDWRRVFPKGEPRHEAWDFNPAYLAAFQDAANGQGVHITGYDAMEPVVIRPVATPEFVGLLMPMKRQDAHPRGIPDWILRPEKAA